MEGYVTVKTEAHVRVKKKINRINELMYSLQYLYTHMEERDRAVVDLAIDEIIKEAEGIREELKKIK